MTVPFFTVANTRLSQRKSFIATKEEKILPAVGSLIKNENEQKEKSFHRCLRAEVNIEEIRSLSLSRSIWLSDQF
jgi:hypothetical protein